MKLTWGTHPNNLGHTDSPGCFRCHDEEHKSKDGASHQPGLRDLPQDVGRWIQSGNGIGRSGNRDHPICDASASRQLPAGNRALPPAELSICELGVAGFPAQAPQQFAAKWRNRRLMPGLTELGHRACTRGARCRVSSMRQRRARPYLRLEERPHGVHTSCLANGRDARDCHRARLRPVRGGQSDRLPPPRPRRRGRVRPRRLPATPGRTRA